MKKKILGGLLASVIVCLAFVFTNASGPSFSVSGTVKMTVDGDSHAQSVAGALIQVIDAQGNVVLPEYTSESNGEFTVPNVNSNNRIRFSYSDEWGSTNTDERQYSRTTIGEEVVLHYQSHVN